MLLLVLLLLLLLDTSNPPTTLTSNPPTHPHHHAAAASSCINMTPVRYFGMNTDVDAVVYLMLVNNLLHDLFPNCITIGE